MGSHCMRLNSRTLENLEIFKNQVKVKYVVAVSMMPVCAIFASHAGVITRMRFS